MKVQVGIHTNRITLRFADEDYAEVRRRVPAPVGRRSWFLQEMDGGVLASRSKVGCAPSRQSGYPGFTFLGNTASTIVRCHAHDREVTFDRAGQFFVPMPPHHLWPWIQDSRSRHRDMTPDKWRWHLVQELNARVRSANRGCFDFDVATLPGWVRKMLQPWELEMLSTNIELVR